MSTAKATSRALRGLHVLADDAPGHSRDPLAQACGACDGGAAVVQLRAKLATDRAALGMAREIRAVTRAAGVLFIVNDRLDLALAAEADGVHLGQDDLPPGRIPEALRSGLLIGRSTHTAEQVAAARAEPIDYIAFGPVFGTRSKASPWSPRGTEALAAAVALAGPIPVVAIGGIGIANIDAVATTGAGAAVISAAVDAADVAEATRALVAAHAAARGDEPPRVPDRGAFTPGAQR